MGDNVINREKRNFETLEVPRGESLVIHRSEIKASRAVIGGSLEIYDSIVNIQKDITFERPKLVKIQGSVVIFSDSYAAIYEEPVKLHIDSSTLQGVESVTLEAKELNITRSKIKAPYLITFIGRRGRLRNVDIVTKDLAFVYGIDVDAATVTADGHVRLFCYSFRARNFKTPKVELHAYNKRLLSSLKGPYPKVREVIVYVRHRSPLDEDELLQRLEGIFPKAEIKFELTPIDLVF